MSKTWKWIIGILAVLVLAGIMLAVGFIGSRMASDGIPGRGLWRGFGGHPMPMMGGSGLAFFGVCFMLGGFAKFVLFAALLYGAYWLGRRNARITVDPPTSPAPSAPAVEPPAAPMAEPAPARRKRTKTG